MRTRLVLLTLCSSLLFALALPNELLPLGSPLIGIVCISGFLASVAVAPTGRFAALLGATFGGTSTLLSSFWLMFFQEFTVWTLGGVVLAYTGFGALLAGFLHGASRMSPVQWRPFAAALVWSVYEYLKSIGFLGYPWGLVAYPVHSVLALIQIASVTGVWGISLIMALANGVVAEGMIRILSSRPFTSPSPPAYARVIAVPVSLLLLCFVFGEIRMTVESRDPAPPTATMLLVQPNTDPWKPYATEGILANQRLTEQAIRGQATEPSETDLVVWSETSLLVDPRGRQSYYSRYPRANPLMQYLSRTGTYHLVGSAVDVDPDNMEWMNGAVLISPHGRVEDFYGKQHPVPFAEAIPFWSNPTVRRFFTDVVGIHTPWVMGSRPTVFRMVDQGGEEFTFSVPVCFEDAFANLCRRFVAKGAQVLVNVTNDSWSRTSSALWQHFVAARFRAVENRAALVRSTNGGITAVVDTTGRIVAALQPFTEDALTCVVPLRQGALTPYTVWGDWLPAVLTVLLLLLLVRNAAYWRRTRNVRSSS